MSGEGKLRSVTGDRLQDWSVREEAGGNRFLVLRPKPGEKPLTNWLVTVNDSPANRKLFAFGKQRRLKRIRGIANKGGPSAKYAELVVTKR